MRGSGSRFWGRCLLLVVSAVVPVLAVAGLPAAAAAQERPIAAWSFDEGEGEVAADSAGEHDATLEGAEWTKGRFGSALYFDDEESCAGVPSSIDLELKEEFTIEAWVKPEGYGVDEPLIFKETEGFFSYSLYLGLQASGKVEGILGEEPEEEIGPDVESDEKIPNDTWTHVAVTFNGNKLRLYVNGELVETAPVEDILSTDGNLRIGGSHVWGPGDAFSGRIDEVRVYNRALDEGEVASDKAAPIQTPQAGSVAAFPSTKAKAKRSKT